jgi:uncharacterized LabA/DUF88 family protein
MKRIGIFIDGSNLYWSAKVLGFRVDFTKILKFYKDQGEVTHAFYFTALPPKDVQSELRRMIDFIDYNGWTVIQKETKQYLNADGASKLKGNMDVEIAVHVGEVAPFITDLVLFSGDGDFRVLLESIQRRYGIHTTVVSARSLVADALRRQSHEFKDLSDLRSQFEHVVVTKDHVATRRGKFLFGPEGE